MPVERDFVANLGLTVVDPSIRDMRPHSALEIGVNVFCQGHIFAVAQSGIGVWFALAIGDYVGGFVALAEAFYY